MSRNKSSMLLKEQEITILALNWRDLKNPKSGGAEVHAHEIFSRNSDQFQIVHFSPKFQGGLPEEIIDGVKYIRKGNCASVIMFAMIYYVRNRKKIDFVIDQCNAHRFFTCFYVRHNKRIFYTHQLYRELWYIMAKFPISQLGYFLETPMLKLNRKDNTITVSESTKKGLIKAGFSEDKITIIPNALSRSRVEKYEELKEKYDVDTFVYAGRYANSKGIHYAVEAVGRLKELSKNVKLLLIGRESKEYIEQVLIPVCNRYGLTLGKEKTNDIVICGFVSEDEKYDILAKSKALVLPSQREGWGIVIIEAAMMGTPSIVFHSAGCIDAVDFGHAGYLCKKNTVDELVNNMLRVINNPKEYEGVRKNAYNFSSQFDWKKSSLIFRNLIYRLYDENILREKNK